jgi:hypothetical protein
VISMPARGCGGLAASNTCTCIAAPVGVYGTLVMFWLFVPPLKAASAGPRPVTNAALQKPDSVVVGWFTENEEPLKFGPVFAATDHVALAGLHGAWAVKLRLNEDEDEMLRLLPWICVADGRVTPAGGETRGAMVQPDGAVRLNELICPLVGVRVKVYEPVVPAGAVPGVTVAVAAPGAADTAGASTPMRRSTPSKISGVRQRGVNKFTVCLLTGRRTNAFAVPRPGDRRMAGEVSRR